MKVAIVGAGPSGLVAAKELVEQGIVPTIFESTESIGGVWRTKDGLVWNNLRTNISKWTCVFSDYAWPEETEDFPTSSQVEQYIKDYAEKFRLIKYIKFKSKVTSLDIIEGNWLLKINKGIIQNFDKVIITTGVFSKPFVPSLLNAEIFKGKSSHSAQYKSVSKSKKRIAVIGGSFSGVDIASELAHSGAEVLFFQTRPTWVLPRYIDYKEENCKLPLDMVFYRRNIMHSSTKTLQEQNRDKHKYLESLTDNGNSIHPSLKVNNYDVPPYVSISDTFLKNVLNKSITPYLDRVNELRSNSILTELGNEFKVDEIIYCTGFECNLNFLSKDVLKTIFYLAKDKFVSFLSDRTVRIPKLKGIYFIGMYRGPYFGAIELQARWVAAMISGNIEEPSNKISNKNWNIEENIRNARPRSQFPHGDYMQFCDSIAEEIKAVPFDSGDRLFEERIINGPFIPAQYRLNGINSKPELAKNFIEKAYQRSSQASIDKT